MSCLVCREAEAAAKRKGWDKDKCSPQLSLYVMIVLSIYIMKKLNMDLRFNYINKYLAIYLFSN